MVNGSSPHVREERAGFLRPVVQTVICTVPWLSVDLVGCAWRALSRLGHPDPFCVRRLSTPSVCAGVVGQGEYRRRFLVTYKREKKVYGQESATPKVMIRRLFHIAEILTRSSDYGCLPPHENELPSEILYCEADAVYPVSDKECSLCHD